MLVRIELDSLYDNLEFFFSLSDLCYPIFHRIHEDVFKNQQSWHVTYYLLHSLWNYTDKSSAMCTVRINEKKNVVCLRVL